MGLEILHVDESGEVCIKCLGCGLDKMIEAPDKKNISVKCKKCGTISSFSINRRRNFRKKDYLGKIWLGKGQAEIADISLGGFCFILEEPYCIPLLVNVIKVNLPVKTPRGEEFFQSVEAQIMSRENGRYGCKFLNFDQSSRGYKDLGFWLRS